MIHRPSPDTVASRPREGVSPPYRVIPTPSTFAGVASPTRSGSTSTVARAAPSSSTASPRAVRGSPCPTDPSRRSLSRAPGQDRRCRRLAPRWPRSSPARRTRDRGPAGASRMASWSPVRDTRSRGRPARSPGTLASSSVSSVNPPPEGPVVGRRRAFPRAAGTGRDRMHRCSAWSMSHRFAAAPRHHPRPGAGMHRHRDPGPGRRRSAPEPTVRVSSAAPPAAAAAVSRPLATQASTVPRKQGLEARAVAPHGHDGNARGWLGVLTVGCREPQAAAQPRLGEGQGGDTDLLAGQVVGGHPGRLGHRDIQRLPRIRLGELEHRRPGAGDREMTEGQIPAVGPGARHDLVERERCERHRRHPGRRRCASPRRHRTRSACRLR